MFAWRYFSVLFSQTCISTVCVHYASVCVYLCLKYNVFPFPRQCIPVFLSFLKKHCFIENLWMAVSIFILYFTQAVSLGSTDVCQTVTVLRCHYLWSALLTSYIDFTLVHISISMRLIHITLFNMCTWKVWGTYIFMDIDSNMQVHTTPHTISFALVIT